MDCHDLVVTSAVGNLEFEARGCAALRCITALGKCLGASCTSGQSRLFHFFKGNRWGHERKAVVTVRVPEVVRCALRIEFSIVIVI